MIAHNLGFNTHFSYYCLPCQNGETVVLCYGFMHHGFFVNIEACSHCFISKLSCIHVCNFLFVFENLHVLMTVKVTTVELCVLYLVNNNKKKTALN